MHPFSTGRRVRARREGSNAKRSRERPTAVPLVPSPRVRGEGGGSRMRGNACSRQTMRVVPPAPTFRLTAKIPQQNQSPHPIFIHPLPACRRINAVPPSDTPGHAKPGEAGPAPGWTTVAGRRPRPLQRSPSAGGGRRNGPDRFAVTAANAGVPWRHTDRRPGSLKKPPGEKDGGVSPRIVNGPGSSAGEGQAGRYHPAGSSRATGQASAKVRHRTDERSMPGRCRTFGFRQRRRLARETHAAGQNAERGAARSHLLIL